MCLRLKLERTLFDNSLGKLTKKIVTEFVNDSGRIGIVFCDGYSVAESVTLMKILCVILLNINKRWTKWLLCNGTLSSNKMV